MCQQIIQFCSSSTKPLLWAGSLLTLLIAIATGYIACSSQSLYLDIDSVVAQEKSLAYYLQLLTAGYLFIITVVCCFAAYYDHKHIIRALAVITTINFALAIAATLMVPSSSELTGLFSERLKEAQRVYNFTDKFPVSNKTLTDSLQQQGVELNGATVLNSSGAKSRTSRMVANDSSPPVTMPPKIAPGPISAQDATKIWDKLQLRGCCGLYNATEEWREGFPKSCCAKPQEGDAQKRIVCKDVDQDHNVPCAEVIGKTGFGLQIVFLLIALVNLYLSIITGISTYRTFHYNEASQTGY